MIEARYDIGVEITGHDFYSWLVVAAGKGANKIVFGIENPKETKWDRETVLERFHSIVEPGPALVGLQSRIGYGGVSGFASPHMMHLVPYVQGGGKIVRVKSVLFPGISEYTVTIRDEPRIKEMNSDKKSWEKFAHKIGARIIEDYNNDPLRLYEKLAVYAGARMNFGVVNGPMHLLTLSEYPVTIFKANVSAANLAKHKVPFGTQLPWACEDQTMVWKDDSYENLMRWFEKWNKKQKVAA